MANPALPCPPRQEKGRDRVTGTQDPRIGPTWQLPVVDVNGNPRSLAITSVDDQVALEPPDGHAWWLDNDAITTLALFLTSCSQRPVTAQGDARPGANQ
jgi:hypothetical protein